jgi:hypothetical protein
MGNAATSSQGWDPSLQDSDALSSDDSGDGVSSTNGRNPAATVRYMRVVAMAGGAVKHMEVARSRRAENSVVPATQHLAGEDDDPTVPETRSTPDLPQPRPAVRVPTPQEEQKQEQEQKPTPAPVVTSTATATLSTTKVRAALCVGWEHGCRTCASSQLVLVWLPRPG